ncbi:hypothetical protein COPR103792_03505 [Corynebacterium propinquum]
MFRRYRQNRLLRQPDLSFPSLSRKDADQLRSSLRRQLAAEGASIRFDGMAATIEHPRRGRMSVRLDDLVRQVASSQHPKAIPNLAASFMTGLDDDTYMEQLDTASLYSRLRLRLVSTRDLSAEEQKVIDAATLFDFTNDTSATIALDTASSIQTIALEKLAEIDDVDALERAARTNLREELRNTDIDVQFHNGPVESPGASAWTFESSSHYLGSAPLLLEEFIDMWAPEIDTTNGLLFSMPTRHLLLVRSVTEGTDLLEGISRMAPVAAQIADSAESTVSPLVHVYDDGEITTISNWTPGSQQIEIAPNTHIMNQLIKGGFDPQAAIESGGGVWESGELPPLPDDFELPDTPADIDEVDGDDNGEPGFGDDRGFGNDHPRRDT